MTARIVHSVAVVLALLVLLVLCVSSHAAETTPSSSPAVSSPTTTPSTPSAPSTASSQPRSVIIPLPPPGTETPAPSATNPPKPTVPATTATTATTATAPATHKPTSSTPPARPSQPSHNGSSPSDPHSTRRVGAAAPSPSREQDVDELPDPFAGQHLVPKNAWVEEKRNKMTAFKTAHVHRDYRSHVDFLHHQTEVFWPLLSSKLDAMGVTDGMSIVDVGAGPGALAGRLAAKYPKSKITCVDIDHVFLEYAARNFSAPFQAKRLQLVHGVASNTSLPDASADVIVSQFTMQHVYDPRNATRELHRVLKPGGRLLVLDADEHLSDLVAPDSPLQQLSEKMNELRVELHAGGHVSGRLVYFFTRLLKALHFRDVKMQPVHADSDDQGPEHFMQLLTPSQYYALIRHRRVSLTTFQSAEKLFARWAEAVVRDKVFHMVSFCLLFTAVKSDKHTHQEALDNEAKTPIPALLDFEHVVQLGASGRLPHLDHRHHDDMHSMHPHDEHDDDLAHTGAYSAGLRRRAAHPDALDDMYGLRSGLGRRRSGPDDHIFDKHSGHGRAAGEFSRLFGTGGDPDRRGSGRDRSGRGRDHEHDDDFSDLLSGRRGGGREGPRPGGRRFRDAHMTGFEDLLGDYSRLPGKASEALSGRRRGRGFGGLSPRSHDEL